MINNITKEGLRSMMLSGEDFILIDTLSRESFEEIHISGAINCPVDEMGKWAEENEDKKDKKIIVYCGSYTCKASATAADILDRAGFARVMRRAALKNGVRRVTRSPACVSRPHRQNCISIHYPRPLNNF